MKVRTSTIEALVKVITGDGQISPYRTGPKLVRYFNDYGTNVEYTSSGFPSRQQYVREELARLNGSNSMREILEDSVHESHYVETEYQASTVADYLNKYLTYDNVQLILEGGVFKVIDSSKQSLMVKTNLKDHLKSEKLNHAFILEQIDKCNEKIQSLDFDGAITNSRTLVEAIFEEILSRFDETSTHADGDLNKLYKQVKERLALDPSRTDISQTLKQILSGLTSIVSGLAGISNKMGDRHARKHSPSMHHAVLAVNVANTLCVFLLSSMNYQQGKS